MIDYWEAIGRLACDANFFHKFLAILPSAESIKTETLTLKAGGATSTCLNIREDKYHAVQDSIGPKLAEQYLSLFAAGELIWTFNRPESRTRFDRIATTISQKVPKSCGPSTSYFITLGLVLVDDRFRQQVVDCTRALPRLSEAEMEQIRNLVGCQEFLDRAEEFDEIPWELGCFVGEVARSEYRQPIALNAGEKTEAKEVAQFWPTPAKGEAAS